jgi:hypothetical protein
MKIDRKQTVALEMFFSHLRVPDAFILEKNQLSMIVFVGLMQIE